MIMIMTDDGPSFECVFYDCDEAIRHVLDLVELKRPTDAPRRPRFLAVRSNGASSLRVHALARTDARLSPPRPNDPAAWLGHFARDPPATAFPLDATGSRYEVAARRARPGARERERGRRRA